MLTDISTRYIHSCPKTNANKPNRNMLETPEKPIVLQSISRLWQIAPICSPTPPKGQGLSTFQVYNPNVAVSNPSLGRHLFLRGVGLGPRECCRHKTISSTFVPKIRKWTRMLKEADSTKMKTKTFILTIFAASTSACIPSSQMLSLNNPLWSGSV